MVTVNGRNFVYPGFLFLILRLFGTFRAIAITQHLLGLLAGAVFLLSWKRAQAFVPNPRIGRVGYDLLGLGGAAVVLLQWPTIAFEQAIRPESICTFVLSVTLYFLIQFLACFFVEHRRTATVAYGIALSFAAIFLASIKPSFVFASLFVLTPIIALLWRKDWLWQKVWFSLGFAVSAAILLLPEYFLRRNDELSRTFLPTTLFAFHANLIRDQLADDLAKNVTLPYSRDRLERLYPTLRAEITKSHTARHYAYHSLGFDPDFLVTTRIRLRCKLVANSGAILQRFVRFIGFITGGSGRNGRSRSSKKSPGKCEPFICLTAGLMSLESLKSLAAHISRVSFLSAILFTAKSGQLIPRPWIS